MRQDEYDSERMKYVNPQATQKRDKLYKELYQNVRLKIKTWSDIVIVVLDIDTNTEWHIRLRNMDAHFYLNDTKRIKQQQILENFNLP